MTKVAGPIAASLEATSSVQALPEACAFCRPQTSNRRCGGRRALVGTVPSGAIGRGRVLRVRMHRSAEEVRSGLCSADRSVQQERQALM